MFGGEQASKSPTLPACHCSLTLAVRAWRPRRGDLTWWPIEQHSARRCDAVLLEQVGRLQRQRHQLA